MRQRRTVGSTQGRADQAGDVRATRAGTLARVRQRHAGTEPAGEG